MSLRLHFHEGHTRSPNVDVAVARTMHCVVADTKNIEEETFTSAFFFVHKCVGDCYNRLCQAPNTTPPVHTKWHHSLLPESTSLLIHSQTRKTSTSTPAVLKRSSAKSDSRPYSPHSPTPPFSQPPTLRKCISPPSTTATTTPVPPALPT